MKKLNLWVRVGLFILIICLGTGAALLASETTGLALADLSDVPVETLTETDDGGTLYASLSGGIQGIYRSADKGRSWQKMNTLPDVAVNALELHPTHPTIFVGTKGVNRNEDSLWYSNNQGETWQPYSLNLPADPNGKLPVVTALTVDPNHPGILYVGTEGRGLYRVQSGYAGFEAIGNSSMQNLHINDVVARPGSQVYAVASEGLMVIEDDDLRRIDTLPDAAVSLAIDPQNPQILYAGTVGYGIHRSIDGGQSWQPLNNGLGLQPGVILRVPAIAVDEDDPQHLALATAYSVDSRLTGEGIYESFNGGEHWVKIGDTRELVNRITIEAGGVYVATNQGLTRYGNPLPATSPGTVFSRSLSNPTLTQALILILTLVLGGVVLLGQIGWLSEKETSTFTIISSRRYQ